MRRPPTNHKFIKAALKVFAGFYALVAFGIAIFLSFNHVDPIGELLMVISEYLFIVMASIIVCSLSGD